MNFRGSGEKGKDATERVLQLRRTAVLGGAQGAPGNVWEHLCLMHEHAGVPEVAEKLGCF